MEDPKKKSDKLLLAGASLPIAEGLMALTHGGFVAGVLGLGLSGLVYIAAEELERHGHPVTLPRLKRRERRERAPGEHGFGYKLFNGKSYRNANGDNEGEPGEEQEGPWIPPQFLLDDVLENVSDFNEQGYVYFGESEKGAAAFHIDDMYHVLDVAKSGRGKSNRFRNAMMQVVGLADTYYLNPFAAPVKSVTDERKIEVWQPIYDRLANKHPVRERDEILHTLEKLVGEIERRSDLEQEWDFSWRAHPIFVFIDEVPEIRARCPEAIDWLDRIGRGGRQFGIFAWVASQSALVQDIGLSTASQAQFKTLIYGGGDKTSGNRVLGSVTPEQEKALKTNGAGLTLMIADGHDETEFVRAPLVTNEALFAYFGLPAFKIDEWLTPKSKQPSQRLADTSNIRQFRPQQDRADDENNGRYGRPVPTNEPSQFELEDDENSSERYGRNVDNEAASEEDGSRQNGDVKLPPGWDQKKLDMLPGFYAVFNHLDKTLQALELSASQRNRDFARSVLKEQGLWKEAK